MKLTGNNSTGTVGSQQASDQALGWVVRLRSDAVQETDMEAFADWLTDSEGNQQAWEQALDLWETAGVLSYLPSQDLLASSESVVEQLNKTGGLLRKYSTGFWRILTATSASLVIAAAVFFAFEDNSQNYYSALGEYKQITLTDGSVIELNTDSAVNVSLDQTVREIELLKGEAFFTVASDKQRPFVVQVGAASVQALGTAFNIYRSQENQIEVAVTEGVVRVSESKGSAVAAPQSKMLVANQAVVVSSASGLAEVTLKTEQATAWRQRQIIFDRASVAQAVASLSRYRQDKIVVADQIQSNRRISGIFSTNEPKQTLLAVAEAFELEVSQQADHWLLSPPNP